jgi:hypothetical protein
MNIHMFRGVIDSTGFPQHAPVESACVSNVELISVALTADAAADLSEVVFDLASFLQ